LHIIFSICSELFSGSRIVAVIFEFKKSVCLAHLVFDLYLMDAFAASLVQTMGKEDPAIEFNRCVSPFLQPAPARLIASH